MVLQNGRRLGAVEIKSASTFSATQLKGLRQFKNTAPEVGESYLVYNGDSYALGDCIQAILYKDVGQIFNPLKN